MDAKHVPAQIGTCHFCSQPLYECAPVSDQPGPLSHVACVVHGRLDRRDYVDDVAPVA
jgi:hypothetical protein